MRPAIDSSGSASWSSGESRSVEHELVYAGVPLRPVFFYTAEEDPSVHSLRYLSNS